ncbi:MAG TPA: tRNA pseudouridine(38-40) synthase TruA [Candidatus Kapabacteria bacterium]|nr:tRNA pseudouridine(38-40) synthase TruA [Candidatus Kapabacteria bacterium]
MVTNYKITVHYDGTRYCGWQFQAPPLKTVQGELMRALQIIAKHRVIVTGSSRTDAGVHSAGLVANFHLKIKIAPESLKKALNSLLTEDIRIVDCEVMDKSFNARFSAKGKIYVYRIFFGQTVSPFTCRFMHHIPYPLNLRQMRKCLPYFIGEKDFSSFTSDDPDKNRIREISEFTMKVRGEEITFTITGKSFLRYMVRNIIGTIIDVGRGKLKPGDLPGIFAAKDRKKGGQAAPPKGLILAKVIY